MNNQTDITPGMRSILIDWLVDVHLKFKVVQETLFLTVNLIDRFNYIFKLDIWVINKLFGQNYN